MKDEGRRTKDEEWGRPKAVATDYEADEADWALEVIAGRQTTGEVRLEAMHDERRQTKDDWWGR